MPRTGSPWQPWKSALRAMTPLSKTMIVIVGRDSKEVILKVYPAGYSRHGALIEQLMQDPKTLLIDTRYSPNSKMPQWTGSALKAKYGDRYRFAGKFLGNVNYKGGPMTLANPARGIEGLVMYLNEGYDLILLCQCPEFSACHRRLIVDLLRGAMPSVEVVMPEQIDQVSKRGK